MSYVFALLAALLMSASSNLASASGDKGWGMDPNGNTTAVAGRCDQGAMIDPNGCPTKNAARSAGVQIDPEGKPGR